MEGKVGADASQRLTQGGILCVSYLTQRGGAVTISLFGHRDFPAAVGAPPAGSLGRSLRSAMPTPKAARVGTVTAAERARGWAAREGPRRHSPTLGIREAVCCYSKVWRSQWR
jgi:hypothetical protein